MDKKLALFFSFRISLKVWHDVGLLERDIKIFNRLSDYFEKIYFFTYGGKEDKEFKEYLASNIEVVTIPCIRTGGRKKILRPFLLVYSILMPIIHWKILKDVDIYRTNQLTGSWSALIAKLIFRKKVVSRCGYVWSLFSYQNKDYPIKCFMKKICEKFACFFSDTVICSSPEAQKYLEKNYKAETQLVPNYVDTELLKPLAIPKIKNSICFVGRLEKQKNLPPLLDALKGLAHKLTIIGSGSMREELQRKSRENNIDVRFISKLPHSKMPRILNQHEIFILPSLYEGNPKVLLEAMSCGLPVIGTNVPGINEIIKHRENGYLCEINAESIKKAILEVLENNALKEKISQNARKTILEEYGLDKVLQKELRIYEAL